MQTKILLLLKAHWSLIIALLVFTFLAQADSLSLKQLCSYDTFCSRLVDHGEIRQPDEALVNLLRRNKGAIYASARKYGVDPRAIMGAILAENTLNVSASDSVQDFLARTGIAKNGRLGGHTFTIGLGQISCDRAEHVEQYFAAKEHRAANRNVCNQLTTVGGSVDNVAKILRQAVDVYGANGMNISGNIGIQTTLYNLGQVEQRAALAKAKHAVPRVNYFGFFVLTQAATLNAAVGQQPSAPKPQAQAAADGAQKPGSKKQAKADSKLAKTDPKQEAKDDAAPDAGDQPTVKGFKASREIQMVSGVPPCAESNAAYRKTPIRFAAERGSFAKGSDLSEVGRAVDCSMGAWILVESPDGKAGWVKESELLSATSRTAQVGTKTCDFKDKGCESKVDTLIAKSKSHLIDTDDETGAHEIQVSMMGESSSNYSWDDSSSALRKRIKISTNDTNSLCFNKTSKAKVASLSEPDVEALTSALENKIKEWNAAGDTSKISSAENLLSDLYTCASGCSGNKDIIQKYLAGSSTELPEIVRDLKTSKTLRTEGQVAKLIKSCQPKFDQKNYELHSAVSGLFDFDESSQRPVDLTKAPIISKLVTACEESIASDSSKMAATANCTTCSANANMDDKLNTTFKSVLLDTSGSSSQGFGAITEAQTDLTNAREASRCVYSPGSTIVAMLPFLKSDCVKFVTAPDLATYSTLSKLYPKKVVFQQYPKKDRFSVHYQNVCSVEKGAK